MLESILILISINVFAILSPGPDMLLLFRNGLSHGRAVGIATVMGICAGLLFHVALAVFGLSVIIANTPWLFQLIKFLGAGYLIYLGASALLSAAKSGFVIQREDIAKSLHKGFRDGLLCNLLNPKVTLFVMSIFSQFADQSASSALRLIYGAVIVGTALVVWSIFILFVQSGFIQVFFEKSQKTINYIFGVLMIGLGLSVAISTLFCLPSEDDPEKPSRNDFEQNRSTRSVSANASRGKGQISRSEWLARQKTK